MTAQAVAGDFGLPPEADPALDAARALARTYLAAQHWEMAPPPLTLLAAQQVRVLRQEAIDRQAELRRKHAERHESDRQRDLAAQRTREARLAAEALEERCGPARRHLRQLEVALEAGQEQLDNARAELNARLLSFTAAASADPHAEHADLAARWAEARDRVQQLDRQVTGLRAAVEAHAARLRAVEAAHLEGRA